MEALGPTDVEIGSVVSLGFGINGERDIVDYSTHVAPKVFVPNHVTAVAVESSSLERIRAGTSRTATSSSGSNIGGVGSSLPGRGAHPVTTLLCSSPLRC